MNSIVMIRTSSLYPHPDNPRKNLGDITELTESVRKNGIMQNLTVVPGRIMGKKEFKAMYVAEGGRKSDAEYAYNKDTAFTPNGYTVVIGHRRLAAAKAAGLKEVPCVVSDMDERQQLCTMMEENMQRQDLTVQEQAYGFQYMLELGETVQSIAQKTGFAEGTVKHRLEIAKLDPKVLQKNMESGNYQLTVNDLIELEKIKDIETRNNILKNVYSRADMVSSIARAVEREKQEAAMERMKPLLEEAGVSPKPKTLFSWSPGMEELKNIDLKKKLPTVLVMPEHPEGAVLYWSVEYDRALVIWAKTDPKKEGKSDKDLEREKEEKKYRELKKAAAEAVEEVRKFIGLIDDCKVKTDTDEFKAVKMIWNTAMANRIEFDPDDIFKARGEAYYNCNEEDRKELMDGFLLRKMPTQMMVMIGAKLNAYLFETYDYGRGYRKENGKRLLAVVGLLTELYEFRPTSGLMKIAEGTHELYKKEKRDA